MNRYHRSLFIGLLTLAACSDEGKSSAGVDDGGSRGGTSAPGDLDGSIANEERPGDAGQDAAASSELDAATPAVTADAQTPDTKDGAVEMGAGSGGSGAPPPFKPSLATGGPQFLTDGQRLGLQLTPANLADDAAVIAIHQEFYGVPWDAFAQNVAPPKEWSDVVSELATFVLDQGKPVFLSLNMLNGGRERLAATARVEAGRIRVDDTTSERCYDFAAAEDRDARKTAYLHYVDFMVKRFSPKYLNFGIEVNLFFERCPEATPGLVAFLNEIYDHVKAADAKLIAFPSFQLDHLYGYADESCADSTKRGDCYDAHYAQLKGIRRDRFAISSYPFLSQIEKVANLPDDWFERAAVRGKEQPLIAETGWLSTSLVARNGQQCVTAFTNTEADATAYVARVLSDAVRLKIELVTWWADRDLLPAQFMTECPCSFNTTWCSVLDAFRGPEQPLNPELPFYGEMALKIFGTMGLRDYDGVPKNDMMKLWAAGK